MENSVFFRPLTKLSGYISTLQDPNEFDSNISLNYSSIYLEYNPKSAFYHNSNSISVLKNSSWLSFTLKNKYFYITHYELQQRKDTVSNFLVNWAFEGSNDHEKWKSIDKRSIESNDPFCSLGASRIFKAKPGVFKSFRIKQQGLLVINKIEIYGFLCNTKEYCQLNSLMKGSCKARADSNLISYFFFVTLCKN